MGIPDKKLPHTGAAQNYGLGPVCVMSNSPQATGSIQGAFALSHWWHSHIVNDRFSVQETGKQGFKYTKSRLLNDPWILSFFLIDKWYSWSFSPSPFALSCDASEVHWEDSLPLRAFVVVFSLDAPVSYKWSSFPLASILCKMTVIHTRVLSHLSRRCVFIYF